MAILKVEPGQSVAVSYADGPVEIDGKFGKQWQYAVVRQGQEEVLYATAGLHRAISDCKARVGDELTITRTGSGTDTRWTVSTATRDAPPGQKLAPVGFSALVNLQDACYQHVRDMYRRLEVEQTPEGVQKSADTLFITSSRIQSVVQEFAPAKEPMKDDEIPF